MSEFDDEMMADPFYAAQTDQEGKTPKERRIVFLIQRTGEMIMQKPTDNDVEELWESDCFPDDDEIAEYAKMIKAVPVEVVRG